MVLLDEQIDAKYEILEKIRVGGMGTIYKARHRLLDEVRVVKAIRRPGAARETSERFLREARAAIKLHHPNVAILHDFAVGHDSQAFIIMEYIDGWNLQEVLRGYGPPPLALTIEIARQTLRALGYLHRLKIIHRDVSPDNLMLTRDPDGGPLVKIIDLGLAKTLEDEPSGILTSAGLFVGKPRYGSPEQFDGGTADERSDLYSFGVVLYELLTGCCPIAGNETSVLMAGHLFLPPRDFTETDPGGRVPEELRAIVLKALAKAPEDRMASAEEFLAALTQIQASFPLAEDTVDALWHVLRPEPTRRAPAPVVHLGSSACTPLEIPRGMVQVPLLVEDFPRPGETRTVSPLTKITSRRRPLPVAPDEPEEETGAWASCPLRMAPAEAEDPSPPAAEAGPPVARSWRKPFGIAGTGLALVLLLQGTGLWRKPPQVELRAPASIPAQAAVFSPDSSKASTPAPLPAAGPGPQPLAETPAATQPAVPPPPRPAPVPVPPMSPGAMILRGQPGIEGPEIKSLPPYSYPAAALGSGRKVSVRIAVLVDENGHVLEAKVPHSQTARADFEAAALEAARKATFFPPLRDGVPGKMWTELFLDFAEPIRDPHLAKEETGAGSAQLPDLAQPPFLR